MNPESTEPQLPYSYNNDGRFFLPVSNQIYQKVYSQYTYHPPTFLIMPQQPVPQPPPKKQKKKKENNREAEVLRARIMELEMRKPEVQIVKEVVTDNEQVSKLEKELRMVKVQLEHEIDNNAAKDRIISELKTQIQKNDLSRSSSLVQLQTQLVEREVLNNQSKRQITRQDGTIKQLEAENQQLRFELDDAHHHIDELQSTHEEVTVEKLTYLSKEVDTWKQKFILLNRECSELREKLMLTEAELESMKKGEVREVKSIVVEKKDNIGRTVDMRQTEQVQIRKSGFMSTLS